MSLNGNNNRRGDRDSPLFINPDVFNNLIHPAGIISRKGIIEYANKPFVDIFGLETDLKKFDWPNLFVSDSKKTVARVFVNALNGAFSSSVVEIKPSGESEEQSITVEILMQPLVANGLVSSVLICIRNIDALPGSYPVNGELFRDNSNDSHYFEYSPLPLIRLSRNMNVLKCSRSFEGVVGYKCEELADSGQQVIKSVFKYDSEKIKNYVSEIFAGNIPFKRIGEMKIRTKGDDERVVNVIIYPVSNKDVTTSIDLLMEDITMLKDLKYRLTIAKRINLLSDIGRGFIHSINNTTNVILNQTQLLQIITEKKTVLEGLKRIEKYVHEVIEHIRRIQNFLDEREEGDVEKEESLLKVINDSVEFVKIHFKVEDSRRRRSISLERNYDNNVNIKTDTRFLRELVIWGILRVASYIEKKGAIKIDLNKSGFYSLSISVEKKSQIDNENIVPFTIDGFSPSDIRNAAEKINFKIIEEE